MVLNTSVCVRTMQTVVTFLTYLVKITPLPPLIFLASWQRQHPELWGRHRQRHLHRQQLRIHGYGGKHPNMCTGLCLDPRAVTLPSLSPQPGLLSAEQHPPLHFTVCLCSSGQEPFKRRPFLNHLHHIAIRIGDTLPRDRPNHFRDFALKPISTVWIWNVSGG